MKKSLKYIKSALRLNILRPINTGSGNFIRLILNLTLGFPENYYSFYGFSIDAKTKPVVMVTKPNIVACAHWPKSTKYEA